MVQSVRRIAGTGYEGCGGWKTEDLTVATAYGWPADFTDDQMLANLLALNLSRAATGA